MRVAILAHGMGQDIKPYLVKQLCSEEAAKCFAHMMEKMGDCWLPANVAIDTDSPTIEQYIKKLLAKQNVDV